MAAEYYTMSELAKVLNRKQAMIYRYFNETEETQIFYFQHHRKRNDNGRGFVYDAAALERLKKRISVEDGQGRGENDAGSSAVPGTPAPDIDAAAYRERVEVLEQQVSKLEQEKSDLEQQIKEIINQNSNLLLLLNQIQAEKQALLPAPRQSIAERVKALFKVKK